MELHAPELAAVLYAPSYLSTQWALSWYGIIPEKTVALTSVSTRPTRSFENPLGGFLYRTVSPRMFFGFDRREILGRPAIVAAPEKALLDAWYLEKGEWSAQRMEVERFDPGAGVDLELLTALAARSGVAKLVRAALAFKQYAGAAQAVDREL